MSAIDFDASIYNVETKANAPYGVWDLIRLAAEIKKSYQDLSEDFKDQLDDIAEILTFKF